MSGSELASERIWLVWVKVGSEANERSHLSARMLAGRAQVAGELVRIIILSGQIITTLYCLEGQRETSCCPKSIQTRLGSG